MTPGGFGACDACLARPWLLARLSQHLELAWVGRKALRDVLALDDVALVRAVGGREHDRVLAELEAFDPAAARASAAGVGVTLVCRCAAAYPERLRTGPDAPRVLHLAGPPARLAAFAGGGIHDGPAAVSVVGARAATEEGKEAARALGRGAASAGVTVVSGMAYGIDAAAHTGALDVAGPTIAVLAGPAERPSPAGLGGLYRRISEGGLVVSELPPGAQPRRWSFPARNRIIAALAQLTVVVEAAARSGSLITADFAAAFGRDVGAVPGRAASARSRGSNLLLREGAAVVLDARDVLDALGGVRATGTEVDEPARLRAGRVSRAGRPVTDAEHALLDALAAGTSSLEALASAPDEIEAVRAALVRLELAGLARRAAGGRWVAVGV